MRVVLLLLLAYRLHAAPSWTHFQDQPPVREEVTAVCTSDASGFSSWLASSQTSVTINQILTDSQGSVWLGGGERVNKPEGNVYTTWPWVAKLDANGCLLFMARIRTAAMTSSPVQSLVADRAGRVWAGGNTAAGSQLPIRIPFTGSFTSGQGGSGFLFRLSADGSQILWSNYLDLGIKRLALDSAENLYLAGTAASFPYLNTLNLPNAGLRSSGPGLIYGAYVLKVSPVADRALAGGYLSGSTFLCGGSSGCDFATRAASVADLTVDGEDNILLSGNSNVRDLTGQSGPGPFVAKIRQGGSSPGLLWIRALSTAAAGSPPYIAPLSRLNSMAVDTAGNILVGGASADAALPTTSGTIQPSFSGPPPNSFERRPDGFILKLNPGGSVLWGTFTGERAISEQVTSVGVDPSGAVWSVVESGTGEGRLLRLAPDGSSILYSESMQRNAVSALPARIAEIIVVANSNLLPQYPTSVVRGWRVEQSGSRRLSAVVNPASGGFAPVVSPGQLLTLYGPGVGSGKPEVFVGNRPAPILFASGNQINIIVPAEIAPGPPVSIDVRSADLPALQSFVEVAAATPQFFQNSSGSALALNEDSSINSAQNRAARGSVIVLFATGTGADGRAAGTVATTPLDRRCCAVSMVNVWGSSALEVLYAGDAPGLVTAVTQINVRLPMSATGNVYLTLNDSATSPIVYVQ